MTAALHRVSAVSVALVLLAVAPTPARADREAEATARHVLILLRVLAYDKALATRAPGDELTVLVISAASGAARADRTRWLAGFALLPKVKAGGRPIRVHAVDYDGERGFDAAVERLRPAAVIVGDGLTGDIPGIRRITRARRASSFSVRESDVRAGLALGVVAAEERDEIVINLDAARAEGARFGAGLLQLARMVDERR